MREALRKKELQGRGKHLGATIAQNKILLLVHPDGSHAWRGAVEEEDA